MTRLGGAPVRPGRRDRRGAAIPGAAILGAALAPARARRSRPRSASPCAARRRRRRPAFSPPVPPRSPASPVCSGAAPGAAASVGRRRAPARARRRSPGSAAVSAVLRSGLAGRCAAGSPDSGAWRRCRRGTLKLRCPGASAARIAAIAGGAPSPSGTGSLCPGSSPEHGGPAAAPAVAIAQPQHRPLRSARLPPLPRFRLRPAPSASPCSTAVSAAAGSASAAPVSAGASFARRAASPEAVSPRTAPASDGRRELRRAPPSAATPARTRRTLAGIGSGLARCVRLPAAYRPLPAASRPARSRPARFRVSLPRRSARAPRWTGRGRTVPGAVSVESTSVLSLHSAAPPAVCTGRRRRGQPNSIARQKSREARAQRSGSSRFTPCP